MIFEGEIKDAKMSSFSSDYQTLIKHIFPLYFLFELLLFNEFENSICKFMLFFQFCNHLFSVDSRIEERKLRFKAETLHGTKRKGGESLWSGSTNLVAISRSRIRLDRCRVEKHYGIFHRGPTRKQ